MRPEIEEAVRPTTPDPLAEHRFGRWLAVTPDPEVRSELERACVLERAGMGEEAIELLSQVHEDHPGAASLLDARGALYAVLGYPRAAAGDFQQSLRLAPERAEIWYALGRTYQELALSRQALEALHRAAELGRDDDDLHLELARAYRALGRRGMAAGRYTLLLTRQAEPSTEFLIEAASLATEGRAEALSAEALGQAVSLLDRGEEGEEATDAWFVRALLTEASGESTDTIASYLRVLEIDGGALVAWTRLALLSLQLDDPETSAEAARAMLEQESDPGRRARLEELLAARLGARGP